MAEPVKPRRLKIDSHAFKMLQATVVVAQRAQAEAQIALTAVLATQGIAEPASVELEEPNTLVVTPRPLPPGPTST